MNETAAATFRTEFNKVRNAAVAKGDLEAAARIELCREYTLRR